jgi:hypothetical protein
METTHTDLFEVFGGRDNLRLMCNAKRFRVTMGGCQVSFWVGDDIVRLQGGGVYYVIQVQNRKTKETRSQHTTLYVENIRSKFEQVTGYSLGF